jgi:hypothetical protein
MRRRAGARTISAALGAVGLVIGLGAMPALAAGSTWTVTPGGTYLASPQDDSPAQLVDQNTKYKIDCSDASWNALLQFKAGSGVANPIGKLKALAISSPCYGQFGGTIVPAGLPWSFRALSYDPGTGEVTGRLLGVHLNLSGGGCTAELDGTGATADDASIAFDFLNGGAEDGNGALGITKLGTGDFHVYGASGCGTDLNNGDEVNLSAEFNLSSPLTITSP